MVGGVDQQFRKPKQVRGTPANRFTALLAAGVSLVCALSGLALYYSPQMNRIVQTHFSAEEVERDRIRREERATLMQATLVGQKSAGDIRKALRYQKKYDTVGPSVSMN